MYKAENGLSPYLSYAESFEPTIGLNGDGRAFKPLRAPQAGSIDGFIRAKGLNGHGGVPLSVLTRGSSGPWPK